MASDQVCSTVASEGFGGDLARFMTTLSDIGHRASLAWVRTVYHSRPRAQWIMFRSVMDGRVRCDRPTESPRQTRALDRSVS
jgi:hypothetical protein